MTLSSHSENQSEDGSVFFMFHRLNRIEDFYYIKENKFVSSFFKKS